MTKTPIAIFVYNRPDHTTRMLASLEACYRLDECQLFIHSDAPSIREHAPGVQAVRTLCKKWAVRHYAEVIEREENLGVDRSIVDAVSEFCKKHGRVIVIEDDLVLHSAFIHFMLESLNKYQDDERVALVSGYIFPVKPTNTYDTLFLPLTSPWGWATWERSWQLFDWDAPGALDALLDDDLRRRFDINNAYLYSKLLTKTLAKKDHRPWDILFYWAIFSNKKLGVYPSYSLVRNEGFDGSGVHFTEKWAGYTPLKNGSIEWAADYKFSRPPEVTIDEQTLHNIESFLYSAHHGRLKRIYGMYINRVKQYLNPQMNLRW